VGDPRFDAAWPADPRLATLLQRAVAAARALDPLTVAAFGEHVDPPGPGDAEATHLAEMRQVATELDALGALPDAPDELDRVALMFGLRRATAAPLLDRPLGARVLERHLLFRLSELLLERPGAVDDLGALVAAGPRLLAASRVLPGTGSKAAGALALDASRRLATVVEACARVISTVPVDVGTRFDFEAALGQLLQAAAEEAGWLLKEYLPGAPEPSPLMPDPVEAGLGLSLDDLEGEAEEALATAVGVLADASPPQAAEPGDLASVDEVRAAWKTAVAAHLERFPLDIAQAVDIREAPAWLRGVVPPLSLVVPPPRPGSNLLLVSGVPREGLEAAVADLYFRDYLPAAVARTHARVARVLLPAPELAEGWRALRSTGPEGAGELAWRAALALGAIALARGAAGIDQVAEMIAAESGLAPDQARLQAMAVAEQPLSALTYIAGRRLLLDGERALGETSVAQWLLHGPLPGAALRTLGA
jgi:hypothetical protein